MGRYGGSNDKSIATRHTWSSPQEPTEDRILEERGRMYEYVAQ